MAYKSDDALPLATLFDDLVRSETRLYNGLDDRLRQAHGIGTAQLELLRFVRDHPGTRVADIAQNFAIGVGATSKGLDRVERSGWLRRVPNPADRRSSLLELTPSGARLTEQAEGTFDEGLDALLDGVAAPGELATVAAFLGRLRASLEAAGVGLPTG